MTLMQRRRALMAQSSGDNIVLPPEYQRVKYIQSSGTQYIDTGIRYHKTTVYLDAEYNSEKNTMMCGAGVSGQMANKSIRIGTATITYRLAVRANNISETQSWHDAAYASNRFKLLANKEENTIIYNGNTYTSPKLDTNQEITVPLYLFAMNWGGASHIATGKLYRATFWDRPTGEILADFIPCVRKSDDAVGLYDTVSQSFFGNAGTGTFTRGGNV